MVPALHITTTSQAVGCDQANSSGRKGAAAADLLSTVSVVYEQFVRSRYCRLRFLLSVYPLKLAEKIGFCFARNDGRFVVEGRFCRLLRLEKIRPADRSPWYTPIYNSIITTTRTLNKETGGGGSLSASLSHTPTPVADDAIKTSSDKKKDKQR